MNTPDPNRLPERRISPQEFEMVIRRAAELQAERAEGETEGVSETEVLRIGRELGLSPMYLRQALTEVEGGGAAEQGTLYRLFGAGAVSVSRTIAADPVRLLRSTEEYLRNREYLVVQRRTRDGLLLVRDSGLGATLGRTFQELRGGFPPLQVENLAITVQPLEEGYAYVTLGVEMRSKRTEHALGAFVGGGFGAAAAGTALAVAVAPPLALVGLPIVGGAYLIARTTYGKTLEQLRVRLEGLLDRMEHGGLDVEEISWRKRLGL